MPKILGPAAEDEDPDTSPAGAKPAWRDAEYAIVAAGPDAFFGDFGVEAYPGGPVEDKNSLERELGTSFRDDLAAETAARQDNIVEVGR
jgi:hypothetical protein